jgi:hypothetical protein
MHLKHFQVDHVKIDRAFIEDLDQDANDEAIVATVASLGRRHRNPYPGATPQVSRLALCSGRAVW